MMSDEFYLDLLRQCGALRTNGHFVLASGNHADTFIAKSDVTAYPGITMGLADHLADSLYPLKPEVIVSPAIGAIVIGFEVAFHLSQLTPNRTVRFVYAEKAAGGGFTLDRGYDLVVRGRRCAVVEDITTSGQTVKQVVECVRGCGGEVVSVGCLWNRGRVTAADIGVPVLESLINRELLHWPAEECPLCAEGRPINTDLGRGAEFLAARTA